MQNMNIKTPEIRFPEFSGKWVEKRLGEVGKIIGGGTPDTNNLKFWNGNIYWLTPTEIVDKKYISNSKRKISEKGLKHSSAKLLPKGTILITTRATIGEVAISQVECTTNQGFQSIIINPQYSNEFFYYLLNRKNIKNEMIRKANGTTFLEINKTSLSKIKIHIPPTLAEQQKIADFLSSVDEKIEIVAKKIEELKKYKKGLLQKLLNVNDKGEPELRFEGFSGKWVEKRLGEISVCEDNKRIPLNEEERKIRKGIYPYWGSTKIMDYVNDYIFDGEYVLLSEDGGYFYDYKDKPIAFYVKGKFWANNHIHVLKIVNNNTKYIYYSLVHKNILAYIIGGTRSKLNQKDLKKIKIHLPPTLAEQEKIASFLSSIDEKIELNEKKLKALKEYKKGLLQKMFV